MSSTVGVLGHVDGLGDGARDERLRGGHHAQVSGVVNGARALGRLEGAVEDRQVLVLDGGRAFDGSGGVDVADDGVGLVAGVAEFEQRRRDGVVDDLDHAAANQLLVLHQREVGLDAGGVAVHHEADGAGGREHGDLRVAVSELLAVGESFVPGGCAGLVERCGHVVLVDVVHRGAVHADDVEERLAVDVPAGASSSGDLDGVRERRGRLERQGRARRSSTTASTLRRT